MFNDVEIQSWIDKHGTATSLTWLVFGTTKEEETNLLIKGLMVRLIENEIERSFALFADPIDEEQARAALIAAFLNTPLSDMGSNQLHAWLVERIEKHLNLI